MSRKGIKVLKDELQQNEEESKLLRPSRSTGQEYKVSQTVHLEGPTLEPQRFAAWKNNASGWEAEFSGWRVC